MKTNYTINGFADLEREEIRLRMRLHKQEEAIKIKLQTLPEEIVKVGISKIVTGILNGDVFKTGVSIFKTVSSFNTGSNSEDSNTEGGILGIIKKIVKDKLSD